VKQRSSKTRPLRRRASSQETQKRVLANGESFAVFDVAGDIVESPLEAPGFYRDTREGKPTLGSRTYGLNDKPSAAVFCQH
jgi:hypothetical protein